jgi:DeoR/GlpR family transcriptional regulator of sugar metabolism
MIRIGVQQPPTRRSAALFFDKVFMGACKIHPEHRLSVIESDEALILAQMVKHAKQVMQLWMQANLVYSRPARQTS